MLYLKYDMPNKQKNVALCLIFHANIFNFDVLVLFLSRVSHISCCIYTGVATGVIAINHIIYKPISYTWNKVLILPNFTVS